MKMRKKRTRKRVLSHTWLQLSSPSQAPPPKIYFHFLHHFIFNLLIFNLFLSKYDIFSTSSCASEVSPRFSSSSLHTPRQLGRGGCTKTRENPGIAKKGTMARVYRVWFVWLVWDFSKKFEARVQRVWCVWDCFQKKIMPVFYRFWCVWRV